MPNPQADLTYTPQEILPPGVTLHELLYEKEMTQSDLATRTGLSTKHINQIVKGTASISAGTALLLERATGLSAATWTALESMYQVEKSRESESRQLALDLGWLKQVPTRELVRRGRIADRDDPVELLREVCNFFGVANRASWEAVWERPTAFRKSRAFVSDPAKTAAWLRIGEIEAAAIECEPFSRAGLLASLEDLRSLTKDPDPAKWVEPLRSRCQAVGIALVMEPEIAGARVNGAARWVTPTKALIQLSLRHRWSDIFWFSFFHEIGHLLLHSKKDVFINDPNSGSGAEQEADAFASDLLIPRKYEPRLASLKSDADVIRFADEIGIGADIVVGRLQFERRWAYNRGHGLKHRFVFKGD